MIPVVDRVLNRISKHSLDLNAVAGTWFRDAIAIKKLRVWQL